MVLLSLTTFLQQTHSCLIYELQFVRQIEVTNFIRFTVYLFKSKIAYLNFQRVGDEKLEKSGKIKGKKNQVFFSQNLTRGKMA